ncbi:CvpA family protein [Oceanobacillus senegalensis]|uniref:CvpA family protein n=1 Tax=Oceanobacillus senegalensis TaxID=1936063 RepID=UPI000A30DAB7|nr:CvpA family protein [Oceanobacillus senegalensis]
MFTLILMMILIFGFLMGLKRGFVLQFLHLIGFVVAFIVAAMYYDTIGSRIALWVPYPELQDDSILANFLQTLPVEGAFYNAIAFALIFFVVKIILQIIASMLDFVASIPILNSVNKLLGAILGFLEVYLLAFIILYILALTPVGTVQEWINGSSLALFILEQTPYFSEKVLELWFSYIGEEQGK